jgi:hypothetical protein
MTDEKNEELEAMIERATPEMKMAVLAMLKAAFSIMEHRDEKRIVAEVTVCVYDDDDRGHCSDILSNWGDPEPIDCGHSVIVTLNQHETIRSFREKVEREFECMCIPCEITVVEVG